MAQIKIGIGKKVVVTAKENPFYYDMGVTRRARGEGKEREYLVEFFNDDMNYWCHWYEIEPLVAQGSSLDER